VQSLDRRPSRNIAVDAFVARKVESAAEITWQMGRPIRYTPGEVGGFEERARYMIEVAPQALADVEVGEKPGFTRFIRRVPLGVVFVIAPWNYPYLTAVNGVISALMAGNAVILKPSAQTPLTAERFAEAFAAAGLPAGAFQHLNLSHAAIIASGAVDFVSFTGSVRGGHSVQEAAAHGFPGTGLELGGKDPAYVRSDADLAHAIENLADGRLLQQRPVLLRDRADLCPRSRL
jgi:acyl-CoA reductase-like NAD-dependent aldehyde dehydrogenase